MPKAARGKLQVPRGGGRSTGPIPSDTSKLLSVWHTRSLSGLLCEAKKTLFLLLALLLLKSAKSCSGQALRPLCCSGQSDKEVSQTLPPAGKVFYISPPALLQMHALSWLWVCIAPACHRSQMNSLIHRGTDPEKKINKKIKKKSSVS